MVVNPVTFVLVGLLSSSFAVSANYPDSWWKYIPESEIESWEIPPQAANREKNEVILSKRTELGIFSNFAATPFVFRGKKYASLEGFWQMMKFPEGADDERINAKVVWKLTRDQVSQLTAFEAKRAGSEAEANMKILNIEWITFEGQKIHYRTRPSDMELHYQIIEHATCAKINQKN